MAKVRRAYSPWVKKGRVISQKPKFGAVLPGGGKVNLVVSRGRKR
jgi:beta-lactam-binding protein with PASTA domain